MRMMILAFALSLIGGVIIVLNGITWLMLALLLSSYLQYPPPRLGFPLFLRGALARLTSYTLLFGIIGLALGLAVILGALLLRSAQRTRAVLGSLLVTLASAASLILGGGYIVGLVLGISGGIIALWELKAFAPPPS